MPGQRRYGTTKSSKLAGLEDKSARLAEKKPPTKVPLLSGERREIRVPNEEPGSEHQPLLLISEDGGGGGLRGVDAFGAGSSRRDNSKLITTALILSYMIGSGILNAPQVFQSSGIGPATILYIISGARGGLASCGCCSPLIAVSMIMSGACRCRLAYVCPG